MRNRGQTEQKSTRGSATVELALVVPLLFIMCMGAADFGRLFYNGVTVANAAAVGSFFGAQNNIKSGDFTGMEQVAQSDGGNLEGITASAERFCDCPDAPADGPDSENAVDCITGTCPTNDYGLPRLFVQSQVRQTFQTLGPYPAIPETTEVGRDAIMRVR